MDIRKQLEKESENKFREFSSCLIPNVSNILGVRLPVLRKIAKEIYRKEDYKKFLEKSDFLYMEEIMLQGMVIGLINEQTEKIIEYIECFIPRIDNWAVCDSFCSGLKFTNKNKKRVWSFLNKYFNSANEYEIRFAYVMSLLYYIDDEYIDEVLNIIDKFKNDGYYARMAVAWAVSICFIKQREKTYEYLKKSRLDSWTFNKSIQKICESNRVDKETKLNLKQMKKL